MSEDDLKDAVKAALQKCPDYKRIKAEMQTAVYKTLVHESENPKPEPSDDAEFIAVDSLILEYLTWRNYYFTTRMFETECSCPIAKLLGRSQLLDYLKVKDSKQSSEMPLLLSILEQMKIQKEDAM